MADKLALLRKYVVTLVKAETDPRRLMDVACVLQGLIQLSAPAAAQPAKPAKTGTSRTTRDKRKAPTLTVVRAPVTDTPH
jgi:hypothetical protein